MESLLKQKLKKDLLLHYGDKFTEYERIITGELSKVTFNMNMKNKNHYRNESNKLDDNDRCCARLWNDHYGGRCTFTKRDDMLCLLHRNILEEKGHLPFNTIYESPPERDKNGNILKWYNVNTIEDHIDCIINENKRRVQSILLNSFVQIVNRDKL